MVETALFGIYRRPAAVPIPPAEPAPAPHPQAPVPSGNSVLAALGIIPSQSPRDTAAPPPRDAATAPHAAAMLTPEPEAATETPPLPGNDAPPAPAITHQLLGLASPAAFIVRASLAESGPIDLTSDRTGLYQPAGFHFAPWSDLVEDRRTGLATGTRLLTAHGEVPVEALAPGDSALTLRGPALLPILWIGRSRTTSPPIRIEADALGPNRPRRAVCVAADHPVYLDQNPVPTPARALVNGVTIYPADLNETELFHIDVGAAEVLLADGLPVASTQRSLVPA